MKRLTKYAIPKLGRGFPKKVPCFSDVIVKNQCPVMFCHKAKKCDSIKNRKCPYLQVMDKLSAYEDTGLEPEEIDSVFIHGVIEENRRLKELAQAEKDGRLVEYMPGDKVYDRFGTPWIVESSEIHLIGAEIKHLYRCGHPGTEDYYAMYTDEIQPREEAEAALKKMGDIKQ